MIKVARLALVGAFVGFALEGCGPLEEGEVADEVETTQGALGGFGGTWNQLTGRVVADGPALALGPTLTAFGLGIGDHQIYVTKQVQGSSTNWTGLWLGMPIANDSFASRPSATGFPGITSGGLAGKLAVVAMASSDSHYWLTIRDQDGGGVEQNWIQVPFGVFTSAPGIAFVKNFAAIGPAKTLVLVGRGLDNKIWFATNTVRVPPGESFLRYENSRWSGFSPIASKTFVGPPAITYGHARGNFEPMLMVSARASDGTFWSTKSFDGTTWSAWVQVPAGIFSDGPALGTGVSGSNQPEVTIFGRGLDNRIWVSAWPTTGVAGFSAIGSTTFDGSPQASSGATNDSSHGRVFVSAIQSGGAAFSNKANSP